jgi:hypothetical protein
VLVPQGAEFLACERDKVAVSGGHRGFGRCAMREARSREKCFVG